MNTTACQNQAIQVLAEVAGLVAVRRLEERVRRRVGRGRHAGRPPSPDTQYSW
jgi:hypothetical protein